MVRVSGLYSWRWKRIFRKWLWGSDCYTRSAESNARLSCLGKARSRPPWGGDPSCWVGIGAAEHGGKVGWACSKRCFLSCDLQSILQIKCQVTMVAFWNFLFKSCSPKTKRWWIKSGLISSLRVVFRSKVAPKVTMAQSHRHASCVTPKACCLVSSSIWCIICNFQL